MTVVSRLTVMVVVAVAGVSAHCLTTAVVGVIAAVVVITVIVGVAGVGVGVAVAVVGVNVRETLRVVVVFFKFCLRSLKLVG